MSYQKQSWSSSFLDAYKTFKGRYTLEMLHSLGSVFDDKYMTDESLQSMMINLANRDDVCFYRLALNAYEQLQKNESVDLTSFFNEEECDYYEYNLSKSNAEEQVNIYLITSTFLNIYFY